jgi:hypothetical protein
LVWKLTIWQPCSAGVTVTINIVVDLVTEPVPRIHLPTCIPHIVLQCRKTPMLNFQPYTFLHLLSRHSEGSGLCSDTGMQKKTHFKDCYPFLLMRGSLPISAVAGFDFARVDVMITIFCDF